MCVGESSLEQTVTAKRPRSGSGRQKTVQQSGRSSSAPIDVLYSARPASILVSSDEDTVHVAGDVFAPIICIDDCIEEELDDMIADGLRADSVGVDTIVDDPIEEVQDEIISRGSSASSVEVWRKTGSHEGRFLGAEDLNQALEVNDWDRVGVLLQSPLLLVSEDIRTVAVALWESGRAIASHRFHRLNPAVPEERVLL